MPTIINNKAIAIFLDYLKLPWNIIEKNLSNGFYELL
jgi:hypothetical protein